MMLQQVERAEHRHREYGNRESQSPIRIWAGDHEDEGNDPKAQADEDERELIAVEQEASKDEGDDLRVKSAANCRPIVIDHALEL